MKFEYNDFAGTLYSRPISTQ